MSCFFLKNNRSGFTLTGLLTVAVLLALAAWFLFPRYWAQLEKTQSLSMQAVIIAISTAEDAYFAQHQTYSEQWADLLPYLQLPSTLQVKASPMENNPADFFFSFNNKQKKQTDGFTVTLRLLPQGQGGTITASRNGALRHRYDLIRTFPQGSTQCLAQATAAESLCQQFMEQTELLELQNLIPAPVSQEPKP